jgi:EmrB/QacA subfamily drug resistance transporter
VVGLTDWFQVVAERDRRWTLIAVCATTFMLLLDLTIVNVALPSMQAQLDAGLTALQWVVDAYALALAALILTAGALADRYGRRLIFVAGVVLFSAASALCGVAWSIGALDVARGLQGLGGAMLFATALALIAHEYRGPERAGAIAVWGATVGAAVASGPLVGGLLTEALGWRWVFFVNIPVGAFALVVALTRIDESRDEGAGYTDIWGLATFSVALFLLVLGVLRGNALGWGSPTIVLLLAGAGLLLVAFVIVELRQERPMLDLSLFRNPAFVSVSLTTFCLGVGMFSLFPFLSIYLQDVLGYSPLQAGIRFLPLTLFIFAVPLATRHFVGRVSARVILAAGMTLIGVALLLMYGIAVGSSWTTLLAGMVVAGIGIGLANPAIAATALRVVEPSRAGMASGFNNTCRLAGVAIGVAALGAALEHRAATTLSSTVGSHDRALAEAVSAGGIRAATGHPNLIHPVTTAFVNGLNLILLIASGAAFLGALLTVALLRPPAEAASATPSEPSRV